MSFGLANGDRLFNMPSALPVMYSHAMVAAAARVLGWSGGTTFDESMIRVNEPTLFSKVPSHLAGHVFSTLAAQTLGEERGHVKIVQHVFREPDIRDALVQPATLPRRDAFKIRSERTTRATTVILGRTTDNPTTEIPGIARMLAAAMATAALSHLEDALRVRIAGSATVDSLLARLYQDATADYVFALCALRARIGFANVNPAMAAPGLRTMVWALFQRALVHSVSSNDRLLMTLQGLGGEAGDAMFVALPSTTAFTAVPSLAGRDPAEPAPSGMYQPLRIVVQQAGASMPVRLSGAELGVSGIAIRSAPASKTGYYSILDTRFADNVTFYTHVELAPREYATRASLRHGATTNPVEVSFAAAVRRLTNFANSDDEPSDDDGLEALPPEEGDWANGYASALASIGKRQLPGLLRVADEDAVDATWVDVAKLLGSDEESIILEIQEALSAYVNRVDPHCLAQYSKAYHALEAALMGVRTGLSDFRVGGEIFLAAMQRGADDGSPAPAARLGHVLLAAMGGGSAALAKVKTFFEGMAQRVERWKDKVVAARGAADQLSNEAAQEKAVEYTLRKEAEQGQVVGNEDERRNAILRGFEQNEGSMREAAVKACEEEGEAAAVREFGFVHSNTVAWTLDAGGWSGVAERIQQAFSEIMAFSAIHAEVGNQADMSAYVDYMSEHIKIARDVIRKDARDRHLAKAGVLTRSRAERRLQDLNLSEALDDISQAGSRVILVDDPAADTFCAAVGAFSQASLALARTVAALSFSGIESAGFRAQLRVSHILHQAKCSASMIDNAAAWSIPVQMRRYAKLLPFTRFTLPHQTQQCPELQLRITVWVPYSIQGSSAVTGVAGGIAVSQTTYAEVSFDIRTEQRTLQCSSSQTLTPLSEFATIRSPLEHITGATNEVDVVYGRGMQYKRRGPNNRVEYTPRTVRDARMPFATIAQLGRGVVSHMAGTSDRPGVVPVHGAPDAMPGLETDRLFKWACETSPLTQRSELAADEAMSQIPLSTLWHIDRSGPGGYSRNSVQFAVSPYLYSLPTAPGSASDSGSPT